MENGQTKPPYRVTSRRPLRGANNKPNISPSLQESPDSLSTSDDSFSQESTFDVSSLSQITQTNDVVESVSNDCSDDLEIRESFYKEQTPLRDRVSDAEHDKQKRTTPSPKSTSLPKESKSSPLYCVAAIFGILAVIVAFYSIKYLFKNGEHPKQTCNQFKNLKHKYPSMDEKLWNTLLISVNRAAYRKPGEAGSFIFLKNSSDTNDGVLKDIIDTTSECFGHTHPLYFESNDFTTNEIAQDYRIFIKQNLESLTKEGIFVVNNLQEIPANAAQIFFAICDAYTPLVEKAIVFFIMDLSYKKNQLANDLRSPTRIAESILQSLWKEGLNKNTLNPLIVRLTENVYWM